MINLDKHKGYAREEVDRLFSQAIRRLNDDPSEEKLLLWNRMEKWAEGYGAASADEKARLDGLFGLAVPDEVKAMLSQQGVVPSEYMRSKIIAHRNYKDTMMMFAWKQLTLSEYLISQATDYDGLQETMQNIRVGLPLAEAEFLENTPRP